MRLSFADHHAPLRGSPLKRGVSAPLPCSRCSSPGRRAPPRHLLAETAPPGCVGERGLLRQIAQSAQPQQVHISLAGAGRVLVWWVTASSTAPATVAYGEKRGQYTKVASGGVTRYKINSYTSGYIHKVLLGQRWKDGLLKPATTYYYRVGGAAGVGPERAFKTLPRWTQSINVAVMADMDSTTAAAATVSRLSRTPHSLLVFPGDLSYANGHQPDWDTWQALIQPAASLRPWMMAPGNHEDEADEGAPSLNPFKAYNARWPMPSTASGSPSNLFYSFDSSSIHWVMLSCYSDYSQGSAQYNWLQADLAKVNRTVTPWLIAAFHEPWYHSNKDHQGSGDDMRMELELILYAAKTDLVVCGHVHAYERTLPLFNNAQDPCGMVHLTVGTAGADLYTSFLSPQPAWSAFRQAAYGFGVLGVGGGSSRGEAVWRWRRNSDAAGVVADEVKLISHASSKAPSQCRV
ncbi:hypothetical protein CLOP_g13959 [Closterium sp. NIES-67]|nr:hypothetical protein CLOP_g13959 [Closterium sp. NIES-67]